tara:strand:- start:231 stop:581 length:351 start_codon:yes stop_codon:yes gene_type:complete
MPQLNKGLSGKTAYVSRVFNVSDQDSSAVVAVGMICLLIAYISGAVIAYNQSLNNKTMTYVNLSLEVVAIVIFLVFHLFWTDWKFVQWFLVLILIAKIIELYLTVINFSNNKIYHK